ncbi:MAG: antibiotic biosynthesis monooxygenase [Dehalococcoidia bacterium]|nr:antibiotic biosynthesis monooxygenase [Chloroflexota bacterium]MBN32659.1 antibiotic biosynthesis monooxygenase [Dehalococcoidia bacterium]|tara:strand:- start:629 stop:1039 length:411 start_codon:yes stop_codon:yes gene_type:complete
MSISNIKLSEETPFLIIARVKVKDGKQKEYIELGKEIDDIVNETEPGMLFHDLNCDSKDSCSFTWTEILKDSSSFVFHLNSPFVKETIKKQVNLIDEWSIEIYGNVSKEVIEKVEELEVPFNYFKTTGVNYVRDFY